MKKIKVYDIIIICLSLFIAVSILFVSKIESTSTDRRVCVIKVDGNIERQIDLSSVTDDEIIKIDNIYGENHILVTKDGVMVTYSDCPQKIEIKDKPISKPGQSLVCLPHRLTIEITGGKNTPDAVTY